MLVLEREADVVSRGGPVLARARAGGKRLRSDGVSRVGWGAGRSAGRRPLARAAGAARARGRTDIDIVVSGASGARPGIGSRPRCCAGGLRRDGRCRPCSLRSPSPVSTAEGSSPRPSWPRAVASFGPTAGFAEADPELRRRPHAGRAAGRRPRARLRRSRPAAPAPGSCWSGRDAPGRGHPGLDAAPTHRRRRPAHARDPVPSCSSSTTARATTPRTRRARPAPRSSAHARTGARGRRCGTPSTSCSSRGATPS